MSVRTISLLRTFAGIALCGALAILAASISRSHSWQLFVPAAYALVVFGLAWRYGKAVGIFGSVVGVLVFAYFLYPPFNSFRVESEAARSGLGWMLLAGLALTYLLIPSREVSKRK